MDAVDAEAAEAAVDAVRVRRARGPELPAVGLLTERAYEPFVLGPDDPYRARLRDAAARDREAEVWVAEVWVAEGLAPEAAAPVLLGTVTVCPPGSGWREVARDDEGEFRMLAVAPDAQGRGVGAALARAVLDRFAADGLRAVVLSSLPAMTAAHGLYRSLGFHRAPDRDHHPAPGVELWAFERPL